MQTLIAKNWDDYALLDSGNGQRLEKYGPYILVRPDPQCIWKPELLENEWKQADAMFEKTSGEKGFWKKPTKIPEKWLCSWKDLCFWVKLSPFKHTGVFPEQSIQWGFLQEKIKKSNKEVNVLNLFAYTGIASVAAAKAGAKVTHVDASYPTIGWAKENQKASKLDENSIRWILDDAIKFCEREIKRGVKYDGIIMDPPIYGHGPTGETWKFENSFPKLVSICKQLLSNQPIFFIVNAYAISASSIMLKNVLEDYLSDLGGDIEYGELALEQKNNRLLSTGIFARWSKDN